MRAASPPTVEGRTWLKKLPMKENLTAARKESAAVPASAISRQRAATRNNCTMPSTAAAASHGALAPARRVQTVSRCTARSERYGGGAGAAAGGGGNGAR